MNCHFMKMWEGSHFPEKVLLTIAQVGLNEQSQTHGSHTRISRHFWHVTTDFTSVLRSSHTFSSLIAWSDFRPSNNVDIQVDIQHQLNHWCLRQLAEKAKFCSLRKLKLKNIVGWSFKKQQHKNKLGPVYLFLLLSFENLGMKVFLLILALFIFFRSQTAKWITLSGHPRRLRLTSVGLIHSFPSNFSLPFSIILLPFHSLDIVIIYVD